MDFDDFWHKYSWHNWPSNGSSSSHLTQRLFLHYLVKTEQTKYALKWTTNVNKLEIRSHKNLVTAVWANEEHRLLTYCSTSCYQTCHWWHVRVSAVQRSSASAREAIELLECETSDFISPDLWCPTALTSIRSVTSSGVSCNSRSIRRRSRMWMNSRSNGLKSGFVWSKNIIDTAINKLEKTSACLCSRKRPTYRTLTVEVEQRDIWIK